jgi:hypothetical protein
MFRSDPIAHQRKQDWSRLRKIVAPTLQVGVSPTVSFSSSMHETLTLPAHIQIDYTHVSNRKWEKMDAEDFIDMMSDPGFLGDPLLKTQHLLEPPNGSRCLTRRLSAIINCALRT